MKSRDFRVTITMMIVGAAIVVSLSGCGQASQPGSSRPAEGIALQITADTLAIARAAAESQADATRAAADATQAAAAQIQADATQTAISIPPASPTPTDTPTPLTPTATPSPIPPTATFTPVPPSATPTSDPRLLWDDFESGIKPEWKMAGDSFTVTNGRLVMENGSLESVVVGGSVRNYEIKFGDLTVNSATVRIMARVQDRDNYMLLECYHRCTFMGCDAFFTWRRIIKGQPQDIPAAAFSIDTAHAPLNLKSLEVEVENNVFRTFVNGERQVYFVDDTFANGGFALQARGAHTSFDSFEAITLP